MWSEMSYNKYNGKDEYEPEIWDIQDDCYEDKLFLVWICKNYGDSEETIWD